MIWHIIVHVDDLFFIYTLAFFSKSKGARDTEGHVGAPCWPAPLAIAGPITWPRLGV